MKLNEAKPIRLFNSNTIISKTEIASKLSVLAIASSLLGEAEFKVEKTEKTDEGRDVYYSIEADGHLKNKVASLGKEEGEWRVERIADAI